MVRYAPKYLKSRVTKRSIEINSHRTSVSVEDGFWTALKEIAATENTSVQNLVLKVEHERTIRNLSSAIRVFVLQYYMNRKFTSRVSSTRRDSRRTDNSRNRSAGRVFR
jgi:predicted DNA-binding ribbon-helix-helix protein